MQFIATKDNMMAGLGTVQKAISSKNTIPILSGIYLKAEDNRLTFAATDLDIAIECKVPVQVIQEGSIVLPARYLMELVRRLPNNNLIFEYQPDTVSVKIIYENAETYIKGWLGEEYPDIPRLQDDFSCNINPSVFKTMVKQTTFCANADDVRPIFTGALFEVTGSDLLLVATDSHRLAYKKGKINNLSDKDAKIIIPVKALQEVSRIIKEDNEDPLNIRCSHNQVCFENSELRFISRLIDGNFPNYNMVIPKDYKSLLKVKKRNLQDAVDRANLFTTEKDGTSILRFNIDNNMINIVSKSDYGMVDENVPIYLDGDPVTIAFNAKYLMDALKNMDFDDLDVTMGGSLSPAVFRAVNDESYLYLLLPLRS